MKQLLPKNSTGCLNSGRNAENKRFSVSHYPGVFSLSVPNKMKCCRRCWWWGGKAEIQANPWENSKRGRKEEKAWVHICGTSVSSWGKHDYEANRLVFLLWPYAPTQLHGGEPHWPWFSPLPHFLIVHWTLETQTHCGTQQTISFQVSSSHIPQTCPSTPRKLVYILQDPTEMLTPVGSLLAIPEKKKKYFLLWVFNALS